MFFGDIQAFWIANNLIQFVLSDYRSAKKRILTEIMLYLEYKNIISISRVACTDRNRNSIEQVFWILVSENLKKALKFHLQSNCFKGFQT